MGMVYRHRESPMAAVDVWYLLATQGSNTSPGPLVVPMNHTKIKQLLVAFGDETPTVAEGGFSILVKLEGDGMKDGEQIIAVGSSTTRLTTAGAQGDGAGVWRFDVDVNVKPGGTVNIYGSTPGGVSVGVPSLGVTLGFA